MEELVKNTAIVNAELVKAVTLLMPGESIEAILDETRNVTLKRVFNSIKAQNFTTVIHLVEELKSGGLTEDDARIVLSWMAQEDERAKALLDSDLIISIFKFISDFKPPGSNRRVWCCTRPKAH
jgi:hypothetical protein